MTGVGFLILFCLSCLLFQCKGTIVSPPVGTEYVFKPGETRKIKWEFNGNPAFRSWSFTSSTNSSLRGLLATISQDGGTNILNRLFEFDIERPSTLVLKNVNQSYNGVYQFTVTVLTASNSDVRVFIAKKPNVTLSCRNHSEVNKRDDFTCVCRGKDGNPPANVTWYKDGNKFGETKTENNTLILSNVNETNSGNYTCVAESYPDDQFMDNKTTVVQVLFVRIAKITFEPECGILGSRSCIVTCESTGFPAPSHTISRGGAVVSSTSTYTIDVVKYSDAGIYKCVAKNKVGNDSDSAYLTVRAKPNVTLSCPSYNEVKKSDDFTCECRDKDGNLRANVTWYKDGKQFSETKTKNNTLTLSNVDETHSGNYKCVARNHLGDEFVDEKTIQVQVIFKPNTKITVGTECEILGSRSCIITCESTGFPAPSHTISHNGVVVSTTKTYTINVVKDSDAGNYKCVAKNKVGNDSDFVNLIVTGNGEDDGTSVVVWHIVVSLVSGIILGFLLSYIIWCSRHRWCKNRKPERNTDAQTNEVDTTYQELDLSKMNTEDNYQSLKGNASANNEPANDEEESTYTKLSAT